ncbi:maturation element for hydrogenase 2 [Georgfuchsia toluolica]|uniref:Maturation element for hydrogenase 2 n=1 Tax=Georgfuchsia toluolica TaxID=424218 RepID=A0A916J328_9PROT|nr:HyaD/HybD family hydrogenase maturation endopeptidase [Georgfuchsia toluolica]CAG4883083.1 maturation element for hydrogenase 2 [Georgfuchsia toluolica]
MRVVVLGIGNTILSDEGAGVHAAAALEAAYELPDNVEVIDGGTAGMELLGPLSDTDFLVVLDAVKAGRTPGTLVKLSGKEVPIFFRAKLSPHQVSICDVLASLEFAGNLPGRIVLIGIEPENLELGTDLTPTVAARISEMVSMAVQELAAFGVPLQPRALAVI